MEFLRNLDKNIFSAINDLSRQSPVWDYVGIFISEYVIFIIAFLVMGYGVWRYVRRVDPGWEFSLKAIVAAGVAGSVKFIFQYVHFRARPEESLGVEPLVGSFDPVAFPSRHTSIAFAFAVFVFFYNKKLGYLLVTLAFLVGLARIYVGLHFPFDVLGGIVAGVLSAALVEWGSKKLIKKGKVEARSQHL
jgi:undecaprenyl-diphosphatase